MRGPPRLASEQQADVPARSADALPPRPAPLPRPAETARYVPKARSASEVKAQKAALAAQAAEAAPNLGAKQPGAAHGQQQPARPPSNAAPPARATRPLALPAVHAAQPAAAGHAAQLGANDVQHAPPSPPRPKPRQQQVVRRQDMWRGDDGRRRKSHLEPLGAQLSSGVHYSSDEDDAQHQAGAVDGGRAAGSSGTGPAAHALAHEPTLRRHREPDQPVVPTFIRFEVDVLPRGEAGARGARRPEADADQIRGSDGALGGALLGAGRAPSEPAADSGDDGASDKALEVDAAADKQIGEQMGDDNSLVYLEDVEKVRPLSLAPVVPSHSHLASRQ